VARPSGWPKNVSFPTDAKLLHAATSGLNGLPRKHGVCQVRKVPNTEVSNGCSRLRRRQNIPFFVRFCRRQFGTSCNRF